MTQVGDPRGEYDKLDVTPSGHGVEDRLRLLEMRMDEMVKKEDLATAIGNLKTSLAENFGDMKEGLATKIGDFKTETAKDIGEAKAYYVERTIAAMFVLLTIVLGLLKLMLP